VRIQSADADRTLYALLDAGYRPREIEISSLAFSGALTGNAVRISTERKDGWIRQLRLTPLPANAYVLAKVIASMVTTVPAVVIVLILGRYAGGVHLAAWRWLAIAGVIWLGGLTFAALAVAIGYRFMPDTVQPVAMGVYFAMSILGGLWFALGGWLQRIGQVLPTYQITRMGTDLIGKGTVSAASAGIVLAWLAGFVLLAVLAVGSTAETM
jgi:ABC-2 type transport system permease protein